MLVIAEADPDRRVHLERLLAPLGEEIVAVGTDVELDRRMSAASPAVDLVVTSAELPDHGGLQALARARDARKKTPFVVFTTVEKSMMRVFVSDGAGTVVSSRLLDESSLRMLAQHLLSQARG